MSESNSPSDEENQEPVSATAPLSQLEKQDRNQLNEAMREKDTLRDEDIRLVRTFLLEYNIEVLNAFNRILLT